MAKGTKILQRRCNNAHVDSTNLVATDSLDSVVLQKRQQLGLQVEWEVAARGADLRAFPWGNTWEPTYCKSAHARSGAAHLEPCGSFATDRSPYGVMDLAGGVSDWTVSPAVTDADTERPDRICRGGSWNHLDLHARLASRHAMAPESVSVSVGFRLAHDP